MNKLIAPFIKNINFILNLFFPIWAHNMSVKRGARFFDMYMRPGENFFAELYLKYITSTIHNIYGEKKIYILDAGCGQGRLSIPLAKNGHRVDAVDFTEKAVEDGKIYAEQEGATVNFMVSDLLSYLSEAEKNKYECVICTEVLHMAPNFDEILDGLIKVLSINGLLILTVRPKIYYILQKIISRDFNKAKYIAINKNGNNIKWYLNWFTKDEIVALLKSSQISDIRCFGIGLTAGMEEDPQSLFCMPAEIEKDVKDKLSEIEQLLAPLYPDSGRYMLVIGKKMKIE